MNGHRLHKPPNLAALLQKFRSFADAKKIDEIRVQLLTVLAVLIIVLSIFYTVTQLLTKILF
jgi:hypothetical protein